VVEVFSRDDSDPASAVPLRSPPFLTTSGTDTNLAFKIISIHGLATIPTPALRRTEHTLDLNSDSDTRERLHLKLGAVRRDREDAQRVRVAEAALPALNSHDGAAGGDDVELEGVREAKPDAVVDL
jgi:hypothetical protein